MILPTLKLAICMFFTTEIQDARQGWRLPVKIPYTKHISTYTLDTSTLFDAIHFCTVIPLLMTP